MKNLLFILLLVSCGNYTDFKEEISSSSPGGSPGIEAGEERELISFEQIKNKVLEPSCIKCHVGYDDYTTVKNDITKILSEVSQNKMPKNAEPLSDDLKNLLRNWYTMGTPLEVSDSDEDNLPGDQVQELVATWESVSKRIIYPKCVACHSPNGQARFLDLSTRQKFFENRDYLLNNFESPESSYLIEVITDPIEPMPPSWSPFTRLTNKEVNILIEWIGKGLP